MKKNLLKSSGLLAVIFGIYCSNFTSVKAMEPTDTPSSTGILSWSSKQRGYTFTPKEKFEMLPEETFGISFKEDQLDPRMRVHLVEVRDSKKQSRKQFSILTSEAFVFEIFGEFTRDTLEKIAKRKWQITSMEFIVKLNKRRLSEKYSYLYKVMGSYKTFPLEQFINEQGYLVEGWFDFFGQISPKHEIPELKHVANVQAKRLGEFGCHIAGIEQTVNILSMSSSIFDQTVSDFKRDSQQIIEAQTVITQEIDEIKRDLAESKSKFYKIKNDSLRKIAISLGYL